MKKIGIFLKVWLNIYINIFFFLLTSIHLCIYIELFDPNNIGEIKNSKTIIIFHSVFEMQCIS